MSAFLPDTAEAAVGALLAAKLDGVDTSSIGGKDINDDGQLVFTPPCARTRYVGSLYSGISDNQALNYNCEHVVEIFCAAENLRSLEAQREDTKALMGRVLVQMAGARLSLSDGSKSEPCRVVDVKSIPEDIVGMIYIVSVAVPGIAQFDGPNANPN